MNWQVNVNEKRTLLDKISVGGIKIMRIENMDTLEDMGILNRKGKYIYKAEDGSVFRSIDIKGDYPIDYFRAGVIKYNKKA